MKKRLAVMDLGTNTFHLLVADVAGGGMSVVYRDRRPVKLGKGGINEGRITTEAMERAVNCMREFRQQCDVLGVDSIKAIGTSALRSAVNGREVTAAIRQAADVNVDVITGEQEAIYIYYGVRAAMDLGTAPSLIVDIGGGSVEFILADRDTIFWKRSLEIGAQRMLEQYHKHDPMLAGELQRLYQHYENAIGELVHAVTLWKPLALVGSSGTFDTLSEVYCIREGLPYRPTDSETPLTVDAFLRIHEELVTKNRALRMQIPGMIEMRVDMIVVASCLIDLLVRTFRFKKIRVSSYSLKEGVLNATS
ncbi:MAG: exopolyphosphatase [Cyclobacteriaceae bacterium]|nr:exopolyphosphatase [Cyclobacteriaceae bacterium]